jgi:putative Ca2+/H+ antiporter (TMEM165/GDT1 family)
MEVILISLILVAIAEMGDKTQIALLLFSAKNKKPLQALGGAMLYEIIGTLVVAFGANALADVLSIPFLKLVSGLAFAAYGVLLILISRKDARKSKAVLENTFAISALTDLGDKSQVATLLLSLRFHDPLGVSLGAVLGLGIVNALVVFLAPTALKKTPIHYAEAIAGLLFIAFGTLSAFA